MRSGSNYSVSNWEENMLYSKTLCRKKKCPLKYNFHHRLFPLSKTGWENTHPFYNVFQVLKRLIKIYITHLPGLYFLMVLHAIFRSADIIFHNLFELHSTLLDKRILSQISHF